jgi:hypothetical protein
MLRLVLCAVLPVAAFAQVVVIGPSDVPGVALTQAFNDLEGRVPVTVSNTGTRAIRAVTVRWVREAGGRQSHGWASRMSDALAPGSSWQVEGPANPWGAEGDPQGVTVSLDSVLFADGELAGPDVSGSRARYTQDRELIQEAIRTVRGLSGGTDEEIRAWLTQISASAGSMHLRSRAPAWLARLPSEGRSALEKILVELSRMEQSVPIVTRP